MPGASVYSEPPAPEAVITQAFTGSLHGRASLCFATSSGIALAKALSGRSPADNAELDSELSGLLLEVGNIVLNGVLGSLSYVLPADLRYPLPELHMSSGRCYPLQADSLCGGNVLLDDLSIRAPQQAFDGTIAIACALGGIQELLESLLEPMQTM